MSNQKSKTEGQTIQWPKQLQRTRSTKHYTCNKRSNNMKSTKIRYEKEV